MCIDKGTYDAISLDPEGAGPKRKTFVESVKRLLEEDGLFVITSCNWTEDELKSHFGGSFAVKKVLPTPKFTFGGVEGNMVTSIVFQKS